MLKLRSKAEAKPAWYCRNNYPSFFRVRNLHWARDDAGIVWVGRSGKIGFAWRSN